MSEKTQTTITLSNGAVNPLPVITMSRDEMLQFMYDIGWTWIRTDCNGHDHLTHRVANRTAIVRVAE